jgi:D-lactate dehydrogenase (cytochrome)
MPMSPTELAAALIELLGADSVVADPAAMRPFLDEPRHRFHTPAAAVVRPRDVAAVQALARWANANRVPLIPQGGNTGLVGAQVPLSGEEVIVSITRLNAVREVNAGAGHMTVEAGVTLKAAQEAAEAAGALFPLWIASHGSARIGGILGSNAGGVQVLAYGNARDLCLGIEAVLADGRLYNGLGSLRKDNTGFDLRNLLIGSEGTLALTTAATMRLFPRPEAVETAVCTVADPAAALELFYLIRERTNRRLTAFEILPRLGVDLQLKHGMLARDPTPSLSPWYVLCEVNRMRGGVTGVLQVALEKALGLGLISDALLAQSEADRQVMWAMREQMSDVQSREGASI